MGHRVVKGLLWAKELAGRPSGIPVGRARGAKALGIRYERTVAKELTQARSGVWFEFQDANGKGWCQTDLLIVGPTLVLVLEVKHTWVAEGHSQIDQLYRPVVEKVFGKPVVGVQICKNLDSGCKAAVVHDLPSAIAIAKLGRAVAIHWTGATRLWPWVAPQRGAHTSLVAAGAAAD